MFLDGEASWRDAPDDAWQDAVRPLARAAAR
jgi:hypothetical protein